MSRHYEAQRRAHHAARIADAPPLSPSDGRHAPNIQWECNGDARLEYERIRVWVTTPGRGNVLKTVAVTACRAGSGATTTAALLAATLASGKQSRVLLVDANFHTTSLDLVFGVTNGLGFVELLRDDRAPNECIQPTGRDNLFVLTTGGIPSYPAAVLDQAAIQRFLERVKADFDFVVFDTAPVLEFPATCALAAAVDGALLVLHADHTPIDDARSARSQLERADAHLVGVILNRSQDHTPPLFRRLTSRV